MRATRKTIRRIGSWALATAMLVGMPLPILARETPETAMLTESEQGNEQIEESPEMQRAEVRGSYSTVGTQGVQMTNLPEATTVPVQVNKVKFEDRGWLYQDGDHDRKDSDGMYWCGNAPERTVELSYFTKDGQLYVARGRTAQQNESVATLSLYPAKADGTAEEPTVLQLALPKWGGFYAAPDGCYYVVTGRDNAERDNEKVVVAVEKFDSNWQLQGKAEFKGAYSNVFEGIATPFYSGGMSMVLANDILVIYTGHEMYNTHQGCIGFEVDTTTMTPLPYQQSRQPYVSHSFNQYVGVDPDDSGVLYFVDHGDGAPRAVQIVRVENGEKRTAKVIDIPFNGTDSTDMHQLNTTNLTVDGLAVSSQKVMTIGKAARNADLCVEGDRNGGTDKGTWNIYLTVTDKTFGDADKVGEFSKLYWLTDYAEDSGLTVTEPRLVPMGDDRWAILYTVRQDKYNCETWVLKLDASGNVTERTVYPKADLHNAGTPIYYNDSFCWLASKTYDILGEVSWTCLKEDGTAYAPYYEIDREKPVVSDVQIENITWDGFDISCIVTDNVEVYTVTVNWQCGNCKGNESLRLREDGRWSAHVTFPSWQHVSGPTTVSVTAKDYAIDTAPHGSGVINNTSNPVTQTIVIPEKVNVRISLSYPRSWNDVEPNGTYISNKLTSLQSYLGDATLADLSNVIVQADGSQKTVAELLSVPGFKLKGLWKWNTDYQIYDENLKVIDQGIHWENGVLVNGPTSGTPDITLWAKYEPITAEFRQASVSLNGDIGLHFYMNLGEEAKKDPNACMKFTLPNGTTQEVLVSSVQPNENGLYQFSAYVAAKEMNRPVKAEMIVNGSAVAEKSYSVYEYGRYILENPGQYSDYVVQTVKAMLNYGAYAQQYFNYHTDAPANANCEYTADELNAVSAETLSDYTYTTSGDSSNVAFCGASLVLESETTLKLFFTVQDGAEVTFVLKDGETEQVLTPTTERGMQCIAIPNIKPNALHKMWTVEVDGLTVNYSALSYAHKALSLNKSEALENLAKAMYLYNQAAVAYLTE